MTEGRPLPSSVKIGYRTFKIEQWDPIDAIGANRYGEVCPTSLKIKIATHYGQVEAANTLQHEILHAIWCTWPIHETDDEERLVSTIANALSTVWLDNPSVLAWISDALHPRASAT